MQVLSHWNVYCPCLATHNVAYQALGLQMKFSQTDIKGPPIKQPPAIRQLMIKVLIRAFPLLFTCVKWPAPI